MDKNKFLDIKSILVYSVWFGAVAGLVEGALLWFSSYKGWLAGRFQVLGQNIENIWGSSIFDLLLFIFIGLMLFLSGRFLPILRAHRVLASLFFLFMIFDWINIFLNSRAGIVVIIILAVGITVQFYWWLERYLEIFRRAVLRTYGLFLSLVVLSFLGIQVAHLLEEQHSISQLPVARSDTPNILIIVVDTLRADHLSIYGYERRTSGFLDELAQRGVLFENACSTSSWTLPAHASLLTGLYPFEYGSDTVLLDDKHPFMSEQLYELGYTTAAFSANANVFNKRNGFGRGFVHFEDHFQTMGDLVRNTVYGRMFEYYVWHKVLDYKDELGRIRAADINNSVFDWLDRQKSGPLFILINYYDVHSPYIPPQPYRSQFSATENPGGLISSYWSAEDLYVDLSPEQLQGEVDAYDGSIAYVDDNISKLMDGFQSRDLLKNTIIIVLSDHGELFGEHGLRAHSNSLYREVILVPLIMSWPGRVPDGVRVSQPVSIASIPATVMELIDADFQNRPLAPSLISLLERPVDASGFPPPLAEVEKLSWVPPQTLTAHGAMKSVITTEWHYITHELYGEEIYNLVDDPKENENLVETDQARSALEFFRECLAGFLKHDGEYSAEFFMVLSIR